MRSPTQQAAAEEDEQFDARKWRDVLIANIEMISKKVEAQAAHLVLQRELDDFKGIVTNSFE